MNPQSALIETTYFLPVYSDEIEWHQLMLAKIPEIILMN